jgi:hypothetical protein
VRARFVVLAYKRLPLDIVAGTTQKQPAQCMRRPFAWAAIEEFTLRCIRIGMWKAGEAVD